MRLEIDVALKKGEGLRVGEEIYKLPFLLGCMGRWVAERQAKLRHRFRALDG